MSRSAKWFRKLFPAGPSRSRKPGHREHVLLVLEGLEERSVPTVIVEPQFGAETTHDDPEESLSSPGVYLIFWGSGSFWTPDKVSQYSNAAQRLLSSDYTSGVAQYGSDGKAAYLGYQVDMNPLPSSFDSDGDQIGAQWDLLSQQNALRAPAGTTLYAFVTPSTGPQIPGASGMNWNTSGHFLIWDGNTSTVDSFSYVFSHELVESMSSPDGDGFMVNPGAGWPKQTTNIGPLSFDQWGQIGDYEPANNYLFHLTSGVKVQAYWSLGDQAFIVPDGSALHQFYVTPLDVPTYINTIGGGQVMNGANVSGFNLDILAYHGAPTNDQISIDTLTNPLNGSTQEIAITVNGETAWFDQGTIHNLDIYTGNGQTTLTLNTLGALQTGGGFNIFAGGDLKVVYTGISSVQQSLTASLNGKLTVVDAAYPHALPVLLSNSSVTVESNAPLQYAPAPLSVVRALEVDGGSNLAFTIQSTPGNIPLSIVTSDVNNTVLVQTASEPVAVATVLGDIITATVQAGNQLTLDNTGDPSSLNVQIASNGVQYRNCVTISLQGMQGLTVNGGSGNTIFTVQSTSTSAPVNLSTGMGTNTVNVAGSAGALTIFARGTDTVTIGSAQTLDGFGSVTVHGDGRTALAVNDQASHSSAGYALVTGRVERDLPTATTLFNYDNVATLTLTASNYGSNYIDIESTAVPTYVNGGATTSGISVAYNLKNLDGIGAYLSIAGASSPVVVYDQADAHAASGTPIAYTVGNDGVTRDAVVNGSKVHTRIDTVPVQGVTLYSSQTRGSQPNTVSAAADTSGPVTLFSGAADAITAGIGGLLTIDAHGGTVTADDRGLHNDSSDTTTDTFTLGYTVTDHTVIRNEHWHMVEYIDWSEIPPNPKDPPRSRPPIVIRDYYYNGTLNYQNVTSLTMDGGQVNSTFTVQSTSANTPVTIVGGGSDQFIVGANGSVKGIRSQLTITGSGLSDTLLVDDSQCTTQDKVTVNSTQVSAAAGQFFGAAVGLTYGNIGALTLNLSQAAGDTVALSPSAVTAFFLGANGAGAELDLDLTGVTNPQQTGTNSGKFTFGNRQAVSFQNFGTVHAH